MGRKRHFRKKVHGHFRYNHSRNLCDFCGKSLEGLPHTCKYCGKTHCSKHLVPENHNCSGLKNIPKDFGDRARYNVNASHRRENIENQYTHHTNSFNKPYHKRFRVKMPKLNSFVVSIILAIATFFLAFYVNYTLTIILEVIVWIYFSCKLYVGAFKWANRVNMGNDLAFFGLRILAGIIVLVSIYVGFVLMLSSILVKNSVPIVIPLFILLFGLIILGVFIVFRTNRRHNIVGIWRA